MHKTLNVKAEDMEALNRALENHGGPFGGEELNGDNVPY